MIEIWEPRYHDKVVLVATHKIKYPLEIRITKGAYKGEYIVDEDDYAVEQMNTKAGGKMSVTCIPLEKLRERRE